MPFRKIIFVYNEVYHVINRGVAQAPIFLNQKEHQRFVDLLDFYRFAHPSLSFSHYTRLPLKEREKFMDDLKNKSSNLVEILAYCLMPNHFHLLLKQKEERGIPIMLANLQNGYAKYFNLKHKRIGPLFQSMFKAVRIETDDQLLHVSRYIHLNPSTSYIVDIEKLSAFHWSSFPEYLGERSSLFVNYEIILSLVGGKQKYKDFIFDQAEYQRELSNIRHLILENP